MRALLVLGSALVLVTGCLNGSRVDLRNPLCLVVAGNVAEQSQRADLYQALVYGVAAWLIHLPNLPGPAITADEGDCDNPPIYIDIKKQSPGECGITYSRPGHYSIFLDPYCGLNPLVFAHELGHVLWKMSHIRNRLSIMSPAANFYPVPADLQMMCEQHPEIKCPRFQWCNGTWEDKNYCPSSSPEDGEKKFRERGR